MPSFSLLSAALSVGLLLSQHTFFHIFFVEHTVLVLSTICLAYILIGVGQEFAHESDIQSYTRDYLAAAVTALLPWFLVAGYLLWAFPAYGWVEAMIIGHFAGPTSSGLLLGLLKTAGLGETWVYQRAQILALFDDLDTILLMLPLTMLLVGWKSILVFHLLLLIAILIYAFRRARTWKIVSSGPALLLYATAMTLFFDGASALAMVYDPQLVLHIEIILPAFALGVLLADTKCSHDYYQPYILALFMFLVGLQLPPLMHVSMQQMTFVELVGHVTVVTLLANIGKCPVIFFYPESRCWYEKMAVAISLFPRGEVGAGLLVLTIAYGIEGPAVVVSMLALSVNLMLTGFFVWVVHFLLDRSATQQSIPSTCKITAHHP